MIDNKDTIFSFILNEVNTGKLDKQIAARIIQYCQQSAENNIKQDIAIIGFSSKLGPAGNQEEISSLLKYGIDAVSNIPESRKTITRMFLPFLSINPDQIDYDKCAYLSELDSFDSDFFQMSPREACLMDPNQRLFLQTSYEALEEAGYGGYALKGSNTGVFVGHSSDFGDEYKRAIQLTEPQSQGISQPGNIKSMIAARISYLLDLHGPALTIDTACSSTLTAIHMACEQLRAGTCDLAIAGGVKVILFPVKGGAHLKMGTESSDEKTKTFDDSSNGTGKGEGVGVVLLKPLKNALKDHDHIHGIIKGGAVNQDGNSIGITAPNPRAQEEVICNAWKNAAIEPETISYIEAHGTGTKLGDPIEIEGISKAFSRYTTKKQFCGIGTLKTNIGHLDNVSGIAGLIKILISFKTKKLFPSLHFSKPNRNIPFNQSPVYVVDQLNEWTSISGPRRAGISSFGLSGTNCHMILEEPPEQIEDSTATVKPAYYILPLSAYQQNVLAKLIESNIEYLNCNRDVNLQDYCFTAATGRGHYTHRLAIVFSEYDELLHKLSNLKQNLVNQDCIWFHKHEIVQQSVAESGESDLKKSITEGERSQYTNKSNEIIGLISPGSNIQTNYHSLAELYVRGAEVEWGKLYTGTICRSLSLPVYPFQKISCWLKDSKQTQPIPLKKQSEPSSLISKDGNNSYKVVYEKEMSVDKDWVLNEHKVAHEYILPGTAYIDLLLSWDKKQRKSSEIRNLAFLTPFALTEGQSRTLMIKVLDDQGEKRFTIVSQDINSNSELKHAEGILGEVKEEVKKSYNIKQLKSGYNSDQEISNVDMESDGYIITGNRWNNIRELYHGENDCLVHLSLSNDFYEDIKDYRCHPALLDNAINIAIRSIDNQLFLPYYYKKLSIYADIPAEIYSYVRWKDEVGINTETATFDITILGLDAQVLIEIEGYTIKRVSGNSLSPRYFEVNWIPVAQNNSSLSIIQEEAVVVFCGSGKFAQKIKAGLDGIFQELIEVKAGNQFKEIEKYRSYQVANRDDYCNLFKLLADKKIVRIVHLMSMQDHEVSDIAGLNIARNNSFDSIQYIVDGLLSNSRYKDLEINLFSNYGHMVIGQEPLLHPHHACLSGIGQIVREEYPQLHFNSIDIDELTDVKIILEELKADSTPYRVAYRDGRRYVEQLTAFSGTSNPEIKIKDGGTYIISGGLGGLGLEVGKYISRMARVSLYLLSRQGIADREIWDDIINSGTDKKKIRQIKGIQEIEQNGSQVHCISIDISHENTMQTFFSTIKEESSTINGVIHCAGVAGEGLLIRKTKPQIDAVLAAKVNGTFLLDRVTRSDARDFFVMFSSINTLLGGMGQSDYVAANGYLDEYSSYLRRIGMHALTINWPAWKDVGMANDFEVDGEDSIFSSLSPESGINIFGEIFKMDAARIVVGELSSGINQKKTGHNLLNDYILSENLTQRFSQHIEPESVNTDSYKATKQDFVIIDKEASTITELEHEIAFIWCRVLGIREVYLNKNFNSMGGNSVLAIDLFRQLEQKFGSIISVSDIFTYSSISEMVNYIQSTTKQKESTSPDTSVEELLKRLAKQEVSIDEAYEEFYNTK